MKILFGITPALTGLAGYILRSQQDIATWRPELVISWAAPLFQHEKKLLMDTFECPVSNNYGSREVGHMAAAGRHTLWSTVPNLRCVTSGGLLVAPSGWDS